MVQWKMTIFETYHSSFRAFNCFFPLNRDYGTESMWVDFVCKKFPKLRRNRQLANWKGEKPWGGFWQAFVGGFDGPVHSGNPRNSTNHWYLLWKRNILLFLSGAFQNFPIFFISVKKSIGCFLSKPGIGVSKNSGTPKWMVYNGKPY